MWFRLGYAALQIEDWKLAAMAYKRYCSLEQFVCTQISDITTFTVDMDFIKFLFYLKISGF